MNGRPGSLVSYRERDWVVLPSDDPQLTLLRPIGGSGREVCGVYEPLAREMGYDLPFERITATEFPSPDADSVQDHSAVKLLLDGARLLLRDGAAPFRSLGHLSLRPRPYQYVPMLMALRASEVRLLIADDVGVGKTIEAALIARELLDRGMIRRVGVLCPPYLCDQWHTELRDKFHLHAEVIRSGTVARLERLSPDVSLFRHIPHFVASIDLVKGEAYRQSFLLNCPDLIIVDEAHGAARPGGSRRSRVQQQRYELLSDLAKLPRKHLVLLTATPHSGVRESFLSLLGLLRPEFGELDFADLTEPERDELAKHFIQRRRPDVRHWMGTDTPFPERETPEEPYSFSPQYREFFNHVYEFARQLVRSAETLTGWKARMRFWSALALMRCVSSSPAAAETSLRKRLGEGSDAVTVADLDAATEEELQGVYEPLVSDPGDAEATDAPPAAVFEAQDQDATWSNTDKRRLREFAQQAAKLQGEPDNKLKVLEKSVRSLLAEGFHPIVWCRYIATSDYVAEELQQRLERSIKVVSITGATAEDERRLKVAELSECEHRVLVATDCLSEGINLQDHFNAVVHYDLPWNPNRLEQREGRVDRFGQTAKVVRAVLMYGKDNPVDGAVLDVLIRKARDIYKDLGTHVPVPADSETVMEAVQKSLFARPVAATKQLDLFEASEVAQTVADFHAEYDEAARREKETRTRFAQRAIKPEEVGQELHESDRILGNPNDVLRFLQEASQRLEFTFRRRNDGRWEIKTEGLPTSVRQAVGNVPDPWVVSFDSPTPEGATFLGRSHPLVESLAEYLVDHAFDPADEQPPAARCGAIRTDAVSRRTTLLLLRLRFLVYERGNDTPTLAEETLTWGFEGIPPNLTPLSPDDAQRLLDQSQPTANVEPAEKREVVEEAIGAWDELQQQLQKVVTIRTKALEESYRRVTRILQQERLRIEPQMPPDLLGVLVLIPVPQGVAR